MSRLAMTSASSARQLLRRALSAEDGADKGALLEAPALLGLAAYIAALNDESEALENLGSEVQYLGRSGGVPSDVGGACALFCGSADGNASAAEDLRRLRACATLVWLGDRLGSSAAEVSLSGTARMLGEKLSGLDFGGTTLEELCLEWFRGRCALWCIAEERVRELLFSSVASGRSLPRRLEGIPFLLREFPWVPLPWVSSAEGPRESGLQATGTSGGIGRALNTVQEVLMHRGRGAMERSLPRFRLLAGEKAVFWAENVRVVEGACCGGGGEEVCLLVTTYRVLVVVTGRCWGTPQQGVFFDVMADVPLSPIDSPAVLPKVVGGRDGKVGLGRPEPVGERKEWSARNKFFVPPSPSHGALQPWGSSLALRSIGRVVSKGADVVISGTLGQTLALNVEHARASGVNLAKGAVSRALEFVKGGATSAPPPLLRIVHGEGSEGDRWAAAGEPMPIVGRDVEEAIESAGAWQLPGVFAKAHARALPPRAVLSAFRYNPAIELQRTKASDAFWRVSALNVDGAVATTYPDLVIAPRSVLDATIVAAASYRTKSRFPAVTWVHRGRALLRSAQPRSGIFRKSNAADAAYIEGILRTVAAEDRRRPVPSEAPADRTRLLIVDCRPSLNEVANRMPGGGTEDPAWYDTRDGGIRVTHEYLGIGNIHAVRDALHSFRHHVRLAWTSERGIVPVLTPKDETSESPILDETDTEAFEARALPPPTSSSTTSKPAPLSRDKGSHRLIVGFPPTSPPSNPVPAPNPEIDDELDDFFDDIMDESGITARRRLPSTESTEEKSRKSSETPKTEHASLKKKEEEEEEEVGRVESPKAEMGERRIRVARMEEIAPGGWAPMSLAIEERAWPRAHAWRETLTSVLAGAMRVSIAMTTERRSVLIHCSDGWDRTAQVSSLAQVIVDPYFRTIEGLAVLIEKEWVAFGHRFARRLGLGVPGGEADYREKHSDSQRSPVFFQFLDCLYQAWHQSPQAFQYSPSYLAAIAHHATSGRYETFLGDTIRHRDATEGLALWDAVLRDPRPFLNPHYRGPTFRDMGASPLGSVAVEVDEAIAQAQSGADAARHIVADTEPARLSDFRLALLVRPDDLVLWPFWLSIWTR